MYIYIQIYAHMHVQQHAYVYVCVYIYTHIYTQEQITKVTAALKEVTAERKVQQGLLKKQLLLLEVARTDRQDVIVEKMAFQQRVLDFEQEGARAYKVC